MKTTEKKIYYRTEARKKLPEILNFVKDSGTAVYIAERGVTQVVIVPVEQYEEKVRKATKFDITKSNLFGMWKDREDMKDSVKWVNDMRKREENRSYPEKLK